MVLIDLSHRLSPDMPTYPGLPKIQYRKILDHTQKATHTKFSNGTSFSIVAYELGGNTGTYLDAPLHRYQNGQDLASVPLERLADIPGTVISITKDGPIEPECLEQVPLSHRAVLFCTGWSRYWNTSKYFQSGPFLTDKTCQKLIDEKVTLVGIDCANIDNMEDPERPAHTLLLGANIPIVEHLCQLESLPIEGFRFFATPPAIEGGTSFPVRAFAIVA